MPVDGSVTTREVVMPEALIEDEEKPLHDPDPRDPGLSNNPGQA